MSLDLGAVIGRVVLETVEFDRAYNRTVGKMRTFGTSAERSAGGVRVLDRSMLGAAGSADKASTSITRLSQSQARQAAAEEKAAAAARVHSEARARVTALMGQYAGESARVQQGALRLAASEARLAELQAKGTATTRQLASAQAGLIGSQRALAKAQAEGAVAAGRFTSGLRSGIKMAAELGLLIGAIEVGKKAIEFIGAGKELTTALNGVQAASHATDTQMKAVRKQAIALGHDLTVPRATAVDAADAINDLVRAGVSLERAMVAARPALLLASAAQVSTADAARILGDTLDEFMLPATKAKAVADALAAGATSAGGGLLDMFDAMKYIGPRARAVGLGVNDVVTAIAELAKAGIQGSIAGTGLAMMLQHIAHMSGPGQKALNDLGVSAWDAQGRFKGLPNLIEQLSAAQKRFGPNAKRFLADISVAFGARAANVVAAFAGKGVKSYNEFAKRVASGDVQEYADKMNRGLGAAMAQIRKQFTAAGIDLYQKLEPALAAAAMWLGTKLPHAIGVLADILGPTVHVVGTVLVTAWTGLSAVLSVVGSALGSIARLAESNKGVLTDLATAVLVTWGVFKGVQAGVWAFRMLRASALITKDALLGVAAATKAVVAGEAAMSMGAFAVGIAAVGVAGYAAGKGINSVVEHGNTMAHVLGNLTNVEQTFRAALEASNGALNDQVLRAVAAELQSDGLARKFKSAGVSLGDLTTAATSGDDAFLQFAKRMKESGKVSDNAIVSLALIHGEYVKTSGAAKELGTVTTKTTTEVKKEAATAKQAAVALMWVVDAHGRLVQVETKTKGAADVATNALKAQTQASTLLKQAMDLLNGVNQTLEVSTDQFSISLGNLRNKTALATDANGKQTASLNQATVAGATNRQMLVGMIDAAKAQAQATADQAAKHGTLENALRVGNKQLAKNEDAIRAAAKAAGMDKGEVDKLIASMGILSKIHPKPKVDVNTTPAQRKAADIQARIDRIRQGKEPYLDANSTEARGVIAELQAEINALQGKTVYIRAVHQSAYVNPNTGEAAGPGAATGGTVRDVVRRRFATGGSPGDGPFGTVVSPGTDTSDSSWIRVSNDEEIIRASQARKHRRLLKAINAGAYRPSLQIPRRGTALRMPASGSAPLTSLHAGNIAEALHGMRLVIDAGSIGTLTGFVDTRVDGTLGRVARTPDARQSRAEAFGRI